MQDFWTVTFIGLMLKIFNYVKLRIQTLLLPQRMTGSIVGKFLGIFALFARNVDATYSAGHRSSCWAPWLS